MALLDDAVSRASASWESMGFSAKTSSKLTMLSGASVGSGSWVALVSLSSWEEGSSLGASVGPAVEDTGWDGSCCLSQPESTMGNSRRTIMIMRAVTSLYFMGVFSFQSFSISKSTGFLLKKRSSAHLFGSLHQVSRCSRPSQRPYPEVLTQCPKTHPRPDGAPAAVLSSDRPRAGLSRRNIRG